MANISAIREQLTSMAILQISLLAIAGIFTMLYTMPKIEEINAQNEATNLVIKKYENTEDNGIAFGELTKTIQSVGKNTELVELIQKAPDETKKVIKKTGSAPYLTWLSQALQNSSEDQVKLEEAKARINTIIPTLSPSVNDKVKEESISLKQYIIFIEKNILNKFSLESSSPIGIDGIRYPDTKGEVKGISNPIGSFDLSLDFKAKNESIGRFLDFIKQTGAPDILTHENASTGIPGIMSNPLITLESLSLTEPLDKSYPNKENAGRVTLRVYVRGSSDSDQLFLKEAFQKKQAELEKNLEITLKACTETVTPCGNIDGLRKFENKFKQFTRSVDTLIGEKNATSVSNIYLLSQQISSLKSLEAEYNSLIK